MLFRLVGLLVLALVSSCGFPGFGAGCTNEIDWVDFVQVGSVQYVASTTSIAPIPESALGPVFTHVKRTLSRKVCDPGYRPKDGDAAFLPAGTAIYEVRGFDPRARLAAHREGRIVIYAPKSRA